jgi:hypothetical protein
VTTRDIEHCAYPGDTRRARPPSTHSRKGDDGATLETCHHVGGMLRTSVVTVLPTHHGEKAKAGLSPGVLFCICICFLLVLSHHVSIDGHLLVLCAHLFVMLLCYSQL